MSKKLSLLLIVVLAVLAVMPTFAQDATDYETVDPTGATVVFWHQHSREREEALNEIIATFNETNEYGITVQGIYQGSYGDIFNQMLTVMNTTDAPNLVVAYQNQAATYQLSDSLVDMNPLLDSLTWGLSAEEQADFFPSFFESDVFSTFDGARLGFPPNRSAEVMYYNADWLAELFAAGAISFEGVPQTPEQFKEASCAAVANPFSAATGDPANAVGYELSTDASRFASWTFSFGGDIFDYETNQFTYNSPAAVESMTFLQDLFEEGCARGITEQFGDQTNFGAGTTLFTIGSSSGIPFYRSAVESGSNHPWSLAPLPYVTEEPVMNIYGGSVSIPKTTPEQELAAWLFVKYYTTPEVQTQWAVASQYFPVRASVAEGLADFFEQDPAYKAGFDLLQFGASEPPVPGYDFVRNLIQEAMAEIVSTPDLDIQARLDEVNTEANEILAEQVAQ
ncbi:MAG: ABC transporter substrate-binding protein [Phototrophicaceae bacterium]|jgi:multiple sugar transport system substrate-binding protein/sn-glycerol 3-phosphate transport system substrate-binding protein